MAVAFVSLTLDIALYQIAQFRKNRQHRRDNTAIIRKTAEKIISISIGASHFVIGP